MQPRSPPTARHIWSVSPMDTATGPDTPVDIGPAQPKVVMATNAMMYFMG